MQWHNVRAKEHPFFKKLGQQADFRGAFVAMGCQVTTKAEFGKICNVKQNKIDEYYGNAFGPDIIFEC